MAMGLLDVMSIVMNVLLTLALLVLSFAAFLYWRDDRRWPCALLAIAAAALLVSVIPLFLRMLTFHLGVWDHPWATALLSGVAYSSWHLWLLLVGQCLALAGAVGLTLELLRCPGRTAAERSG